MRFLFRCDATAELGGGHVMRCLTLARALTERGHECLFLCRPGAVDVVPALGRSGQAVRDLGAQEDMAVAAAAFRPDWIVVDDYASGAEQDSRLRAATGARILAIDDLANRTRDCDLLLDQNLGRSAEDYAGLVPEGARILAGPHFALLRPEFAAARAEALERRAAGGPVRRILVSLGMTDVGGVTLPVVTAALAAAPGASIDVAISSRAPSLAALRALACEMPELNLHVDDADMCRLMIEADLAIGAAGSTSWERCCLGLPTIALVLADNQRSAARELEEAGVVILVKSSIHEALSSLIADAVLRQEMSNSASRVCDGLGAFRVADHFDVDGRSREISGHGMPACKRHGTISPLL